MVENTVRLEVGRLYRLKVGLDNGLCIGAVFLALGLVIDNTVIRVKILTNKGNTVTLTMDKNIYDGLAHMWFEPLS